MQAITAATIALELIGDAAGCRELPMQQIAILLALAGSPEPLQQKDLIEVSGVSQASVSRNCAQLGEGVRDVGGYGLIETYPDRKNKRRNLVRLTEGKGEALRRRLEALDVPLTARYAPKVFTVLPRRQTEQGAF